MDDISLTGLESGKTTVSAETVEALRAQLRGSLLVEKDASYDEARTIWNAMIDRKPGLIVRCAELPMSSSRCALRETTGYSLPFVAAGTILPAARSATAA